MGRVVQRWLYRFGTAGAPAPSPAASNRAVFEKPNGSRIRMVVGHGEGHFSRRHDDRLDQLGAGPPLILVSGGLLTVRSTQPSRTALAAHFTVLNYDRPGRGDSTDALPFALEREVEDLDVLLAAAGGSATVVGLSSGAALAAEAALRGLPIDTLVIGEPLFSINADGQRRYEEYADRLRAPLADGRKADALAHFMRFVGLPDDMIDGMRRCHTGSSASAWLRRWRTTPRR